MAVARVQVRSRRKLTAFRGYSPAMRHSTQEGRDVPEGPGGGAGHRRLLRRAVDLGLWALVLGLLVWRFGPQVGAALGLGRGSEPAPPFEVVTLDGDTIRLAELEGRVVLLNFWATWCAPCRLEMPGFQRAWEDYRGEGVVFLGLSTDRGPPRDVERWIAERDITYPVALAPASVLRAYGGARVLPTSILIGPDGRIAHRIQGFYAEPALRAAIRRLLD